jgi:hypothetical protein
MSPVMFPPLRPATLAEWFLKAGNESMGPGRHPRAFMGRARLVDSRFRDGVTEAAGALLVTVFQRKVV